MRDVDRPRLPDDDDFLDGCDLSGLTEHISDEDAPYIVLFADLAGTTDLEASERRRLEWVELFGGRRRAP